MFDVVTFGSATIDVFLGTGDKLFGKHKNGKITVPFGSKIVVEDINFHAGGGGTNSAVAFSRMGQKVSFLGNVSGSFQAEFILQHLRADKVDTSLLIRKGHMSGYSAILDAKGRDRTILAHKGCNDKIKWNDVNKKKLKTKWIYMTSLMGESFKTAVRLANFAHDNGIKLMFNPSSYLVKKGVRFLRPILKYTDILVFNMEEATLLVGKKKIDLMLKAIWKTGPGIVVITDGKKPAYAYDGETRYSITPCNVNVVETTGAGDSFGAGFLVGYVKTKDISQALKVGQANAESVISQYGAHNGLLSWNQALRDVKKKKCKVITKEI